MGQGTGDHPGYAGLTTMQPFISVETEGTKKSLALVLFSAIFVFGLLFVQHFVFADSYTLSRAPAGNGYYGDGPGYYGQGGTNIPAGTYDFYCAAGDASTNEIYVGEANIVFPVTWLGGDWNQADFTQDTVGDPLSLDVNTAYDCGDTVTFNSAEPSAPSVPTIGALGLYESDGSTPIHEGSSTAESTVVLWATPYSTSTDSLVVRFELSTSTDFANPTVVTSSPVASGEAVSESFPDLTNGYYHWRALTMDTVIDFPSAFGMADNADFFVVLPNTAYITLGEARAGNGYYGDGAGYYGQGGTNIPAGTYYFRCAAGDESSNEIYVGEANIVFPVSYWGNDWNEADFTRDTGGDPLSLDVNTAYDCGNTVTFYTSPPGPMIESFGQYKSDATTTIDEGATTTESTVVFGAQLLGNTTTEQLQVEVEPSGTNFINVPDASSTWISPGGNATATFEMPPESISDGGYHWQARVRDYNDVTSSWQMFGPNSSATDFTINTVPLYTQTYSPYPSYASTTDWHNDLYDSSSAIDCGQGTGITATIGYCGCAITSVVMDLRYFRVTTDKLGEDVNPGTLNTWLTDNGGYTSDGSLYWPSIEDYASSSSGGSIVLDPNSGAWIWYVVKRNASLS